MTQITKLAREAGYDAYMAYGRGDDQVDQKSIRIGNKADVYRHGLVTRLSGRHGFSSQKATRSFLAKVDEIKPDAIHLHNIHGYYLNIELLFNYIKANEIPIIWTLHDCWAFTGHCAYFDYVGCEKWKTGCFECPQIHTYPKSMLIDYSRKAFERKKNLFTEVKNMTIVTPSKWLKDLVGESFLKDYETFVIHNGVDIKTFSPKKIDKTKYGINPESFVILGVAAQFSLRKGLKYFLELSETMSHDTTIFLVGLNDKQMKSLPKNVIGMKRTENIEQLVEIYSMADVFVNPTLEDNFPTTNLEAMACGTPIITFRTGGSPETIDERTGIVVEKGNSEGLLGAIDFIKSSGKSTFFENCIRRSLESFNSYDRFRNYFELYGKLLG